MATTVKSGRMSGKVAIVTGGGSGIGRATALLLAKEGATAIVADVNLSAAAGVADEITAAGGTAEAVALDVSDEAAWQAVVDLVVERHERLDVLVNNAGISISKPVAESSLADWRRVLAVNLDGVFLGTRCVIPAMKHGGSIVNVASVSGIKPTPGAAAYCASKAAIRMFSKAVAVELTDAGTGIRVNVVSPAGVKTPMWEKEAFFQAMIKEHGSSEKAFAAMSGGVPSQQFFSAEEVATTILYLASDESAHLTGVEIVLDRGHTG